MIKKIKAMFIVLLKLISSSGLGLFERKLISNLDKSNTPMVFIIGAPRSGTSLLYELLIRKYKFSYISNLAQKFSTTPVTVTKFGMSLIEKWNKQPCDLYNSNYGNLDGWGGASEGGAIWGRWIPETHYLDESHIDKIPSKILQNTINALSVVMHAPFINKNVMHSVHMRLLNKLFPNCLFIHISRDIKSNVRSIIRAHSKFSGHKSEWFSVKPKEYEKYENESIVQRSVIQVHYINKNIIEDAEYIGSHRVYSITYEDACNDSSAVINGIFLFLKNNGVVVQERDIKLPELSISKSVELEHNIENEIDSCISKLV